jgi:hypothetical protein
MMAVVCEVEEDDLGRIEVWVERMKLEGRRRQFGL